MTTLILLALVQAAPHAGGLAATGPDGSVVIGAVPATTNFER